jgi:hypothetical protein
MRLHRVLGSIVTAVLFGCCAQTVSACSICRCGDPTFNALGSDSYHAEGFRAALDWERFDKSQGDPAVEAEGVVENRFTALLSYGFSDRLAVTGRIPFSHRNLAATEEGVAEEPTTSNGLSDPEFYAQFRLWASPFGPGLGRRSSLSLIGGVKTAWGQNDKRDADGERLDEHAQPGTGSTDLFGGVSWLYLFNKNSALFASAQYRHPDENDFAYRYGRTILGNVAYEHKLGSRVDGVVELNGRHAKRDTVDAEGTIDGDTGGTLLYVTPRLIVSLGKGVVLRAAVQIPIVKDLYGTQEEHAVANVGVTYLFRH